MIAGCSPLYIHTGLLVCSQKAKIQNKHETQVKYSAKKVWQQGRIVSSSGFTRLTILICRLLGKLEFYGINGPILKWIESFLTGRTQSVLCDGEHSDGEKVLSGVPQGTVLAPLLFLLHINELPAVIDDN